MTINFDSEDIGSNTSDNRTFEDVLTSFVSRRSVLAGGAAAAAFVFAGACSAKASAVEPTRRTASGAAARKRPPINFTSIPLQNSAIWSSEALELSSAIHRCDRSCSA